MYTTIVHWALLIAAQLGVEPNTALGQAYLIPMAASASSIRVTKGRLMQRTEQEKLSITAGSC